MSSAERWLPIAGYEGYYEVSDLGRVRSLPRSVTATRDGGPVTWNLQSRVLASRPAPHHLAVTLSRGGVRDHRRVHLLVLEAFIGPRPAGEWGLHFDDNRDNNQLGNLYWAPPPQNSHDQVRNGRHPMANKTCCINGHDFTPENTKPRPGGGRWCVECSRSNSRESAERARRASGVPIRERRAAARA